MVTKLIARPGQVIRYYKNEGKEIPWEIVKDCQTASGGILQSGLKNRKKNLIFRIFGIMSVTKNNCMPAKI